MRRAIRTTVFYSNTNNILTSKLTTTLFPELIMNKILLLSHATSTKKYECLTMVEVAYIAGKISGILNHINEEHLLNRNTLPLLEKNKDFIIEKAENELLRYYGFTGIIPGEISSISREQSIRCLLEARQLLNKEGCAIIDEAIKICSKDNPKMVELIKKHEDTAVKRLIESRVVEGKEQGRS